MNKELLCDYEAPNIEIVEMVLENGIAFTVTKDGSEIVELEESTGDGWGEFYE